MGEDERRSLVLIVGLVVAMPGTTTSAITSVRPFCVVNNGLAPPNPDNVIDDATRSDNYVHVHHVGWPPGDPAAPCPAPGGPTEVALTNGDQVMTLDAYESSTITISGENLEVDGVSVPYGDSAAQTGTLTARLASGDTISMVSYQGYQGGWAETPCSVERPCSGTITLVPPSPNTLTLSLRLQLALVAGLFGAGLAVSRRGG